MTHSMQTSRKGSSIYEDMTSRTSSGFAEDFNFRPDTAPENPREQSSGLPISSLALDDRSRSVPLNMKIPGKRDQADPVKLSVTLREILQSGKTDDQGSVKLRPKTVSPKVGETLQKDQPWYMLMLREKEERLLHMGDEINRLSLFELESKQKDNEIFDLRRQMAQHVAIQTTEDAQSHSIISDLKQRMEILSDEIVRLALYEEDNKQKDQLIDELQEKLATVEIELQTVTKTQTERPTESISFNGSTTIMTEVDRSKGIENKNFVDGRSYDEQVRNLQDSLKSVGADADALREKFDYLVPEKLTPEDEVMLMKDEIVNKTEIILSLEQEIEEMQKALTMNEGFIDSLQRDLHSSENRVVKVITQAEKAEAKLNEAVAESQAMSKKFSELRESRKHNDMATENEHELTLMRAAFVEAQTKIEKMKEKMDKQSKEIRDLHRKVKKANELDRKQSEEIRNLCSDLEDMRRSEQLSRVAAEQMSAKFERLRSRIIQAVFVTPGAAHLDSAVSDAVVFNAVKKIIDDRSEFHKTLEETIPDFPPLLIELDTTQDDDKAEDIVPSPERKSGRAGRKSPKHR